jgi:hypothetical protein
MAEGMQLRNFAQSTIDAYTYHVDQFCNHFGKPEMTSARNKSENSNSIWSTTECVLGPLPVRCFLSILKARAEALRRRGPVNLISVCTSSSAPPRLCARLSWSRAIPKLAQRRWDAEVQ